MKIEKQPEGYQWIAKKSRNPNEVPTSRAYPVTNPLPNISNPDRKRNKPWRIENVVSPPKSNLPTKYSVEISNLFEVLSGHKEQEHPKIKQASLYHSRAALVHSSASPIRRGGKSGSIVDGDDSKRVENALYQKSQFHAHRKINCNLWGNHQSVDVKSSWSSFPSGSLSSCPIIFFHD